MKIQVCMGKACKERFSKYILTRLNSDKKFYNLNNTAIEECPCTGNCKVGPTVIIDGNTETYMNPAKVSKIIIDKKNNKNRKK